MVNNIFKSNLTLDFSNEEREKNYKRHNLINLKNYNKITSIITLMISMT
jgi:hypothetical protein